MSGSQQREYPWGETDPGTASQYAIYGSGTSYCYYPPTTRYREAGFRCARTP